MPVSIGSRLQGRISAQLGIFSPLWPERLLVSTANPVLVINMSRFAQANANAAKKVIHEALTA